MNFVIFIVALTLLAHPIAAFTNGMKHSRFASASVSMSTKSDTKSIAVVESPDFYWQFRLDRLVSKKGSELAYSPANYPDVSGTQALYDAYYLDLTLQGKLNGFNWKDEKKISDSEWLSVYSSITKWSVKAAKANRPDTSNLPTNDFDLLKQFYPQLEYRELETSFSESEVGANFPYNNMKEMISAAANGKLNIPGTTASTVIDASEAKKSLAALKVKTMAKIETIYADTMKFAETPFPDAESRTHYQALKKKLADFPQGSAGWATFRSNMEKEVDEMARLAAKKADPHHHHHDDGHHEPTPAEEFQSKYGLSLDELQEMMSKFKSNPNNFLEVSIMEKYGKNGLEIWKKSQEFAEKYALSSAADIASTESKFTEFLKQV